MTKPERTKYHVHDCRGSISIFNLKCKPTLRIRHNSYRLHTSSRSLLSFKIKCKSEGIVQKIWYHAFSNSISYTTICWRSFSIFRYLKFMLKKEVFMFPWGSRFQNSRFQVRHYEHCLQYILAIVGTIWISNYKKSTFGNCKSMEDNGGNACSHTLIKKGEIELFAVLMQCMEIGFPSSIFCKVMLLCFNAHGLYACLCKAFA